MKQIIEEFRYRKKFLANIDYEEAKARLSELYSWLIGVEEIKNIIEKIRSNVKIVESNKLLKIPSSPDEIISFGIYLFERIANGENLYDLAYEFGIDSKYGSSKIQDVSDAVFEKYIQPVIEYIDLELEKLIENSSINIPFQLTDLQPNYPLEIHESLIKFFRDYPDINRNAFIMMQFGDTKAHNSILQAIKDVLSKYGINALRADEKEYHEDLFPNVLTYLHGSKFGIAIFERLEKEEFNPNVSFEVGYLRALRRPICLMKDKTLKTLQTDLVGKLYKSFDPQEPEKTIPTELEKWLRDKEIIT